MFICNMCGIDCSCVFNNPYKNNVNMKVNEAPEKIFLEWYRIGDKKYRDWCIIPKTNDGPIEYTRTDTFIEKAAEWLEDNAIEYWGTEAVDNGMMIDDFKKAMKL